MKMNVGFVNFQKKQVYNCIDIFYFLENNVSLVWKYSKTIHQNKRTYYYPKSSEFQEGDFSWRNFSNEFVTFIINWVSKFGKESIPEKILEVIQNLKILHIVSNEMYKDMKKF